MGSKGRVIKEDIKDNHLRVILLGHPNEVGNSAALENKRLAPFHVCVMVNVDEHDLVRKSIPNERALLAFGCINDATFPTIHKCCCLFMNHSVDRSVEEFFHSLEMGKIEKYSSNCNTDGDINEKTNPFFALPLAPIKIVKDFPYRFQNYLKNLDSLILKIYELLNTTCN
jgi:hypothetical protein